jgi:hypothetical protein
MLGERHEEAGMPGRSTHPIGMDVLRAATAAITTSTFFWPD